MNSYNALSLTYKTGVSSLKLEEIISQDEYHSYCYAIHVLKGRFELGEEAISKDSYYSYFYALYVLKGRFRLGEKIMSKDWFYSFEYLVKVMRYDHE